MPVSLSSGNSFRIIAIAWATLLVPSVLKLGAATPPSLEDAWKSPPREARLGAYWWWLNGNVTKEAITRDLEAMKQAGFGNAVIFDADGASQDGNDKVPPGPTFGTPPWRELYKHAIREAHRLDLTLSLNIQSGWNLGGPTVTAADAAKIAVWSETIIKGPQAFSGKLAEPAHKDRFYQDSSVVAWRVPQVSGRKNKPISKLGDKTLQKVIKGSTPDMKYLLSDGPSTPGEEATSASAVVDLTSFLSKDGGLRWNVPEGNWKILRFGATVGPRARVSTASADWKGYALDVLDEGAFKRYWDAVVTPLLDDAGPLAGSTLKYLHTDSWEIEPINWTPTLPAEFKKRRGYDITPWMPVIAGNIVESREASSRFLNDFRRTLGDLAIDNHYKPFLKWAHARGFQIHPESGGPHVVPIDAQQCLGLSDVPMSEFWAESWKHRIGDPNRFFVKQPASAAHTTGSNLVMAEGFTTVGPHWQERIWNNLKPSFDKACMEGLNSLVWHAWVCSPDSTGIPGQQYFAGTHLNPKVTWFSRGKPFFDYINRCQVMLQRGVPVSDVLYYYGNHVPNYTQLRDQDPAGVGKGYDYDVITEDALLSRVSVKDGRLVLPEGTSYRVLLLPDYDAISLPVLRKVREFVAAGASVAGPKPKEASGLVEADKGDAEVKQLADALWSPAAKQRVGNVKTGRKALDTLGLTEDFSYVGGDEKTAVGYVHRRDGDAEIYFVTSRGERPESLQCSFRVTGKVAELWDPVSGGCTLAGESKEKNGITTLPLDFNPCGSVFVVFRDASAKQKANSPQMTTAMELTGPWTVSFDPEWGGPATAAFDQLISWTERPEPGIKYYSGTATYRKTFDFRAASSSAEEEFTLDLGAVAELAEVRLNGKSLGIVWSPPFRVNLTTALKPAGNQLEIDIVNFWPNRIIGDASLTTNQHVTQTNIRKLTVETKLMESGLLGPVRILKRP